MTLWLHQGFLCHVCEQLEVAAVLLEPQLDPAPVRKSQETAEVEDARTGDLKDNVVPRRQDGRQSHAADVRSLRWAMDSADTGCASRVALRMFLLSCHAEVRAGGGKVCGGGRDLPQQWAC